MRWIKRALVVLVVVVVVLLVTVRIRYGGGRPFIDLTVAPILPESALGGRRGVPGADRQRRRQP